MTVRRLVLALLALAAVLTGCASTLSGQPVGAGSASGAARGSETATTPPAASGTTPPAAMSAPRIGPAGVKVEISVFEDLACPPCAHFDPSLQVVIDKYLATGKVAFTIYDLNFLDSTSGGNRYSSRAANATLCAAAISIDDFRTYQSALLRDQPAEGANGRTDAELIATAQRAGITSSSFAACVRNEDHAATVKATQATATSRGVSSVPTAYVNDKQVSPLDSESLSNAIAAAL